MVRNKIIKITIVIIIVAIVILAAASIIKFPESKKILKEGLESTCFSYEEDKEITITGYNYNICSKNIEIPEEIDGKRVTKIGEYAFRKMEITSVKIPDSVILIDDFAFLENNLTEIKLPKDLKEIGYGAFETNKLKYVSIPDKVETIEHYAFFENDLEAFEIGKSVNKIELLALANNPNLKNVIIKQEKGKLDTGLMGTSAEITYTN